jgi:hypothetical protein
MSSTNESPDIDNVRKKQKGVINNEDELTWEKGKNFLISVVFILLLVFSYFSLSGLILFGCKVAQSGLMPTEENCFPYEDEKCECNFGEIKTTCNIFETFWEDVKKSEKINFIIPPLMPLKDDNIDKEKIEKIKELTEEFKTMYENTDIYNTFLEKFESINELNSGEILKYINKYMFKENTENSVLNWLRNKKLSSESSLLYYFYSIFQTIFVYDFKFLETIFEWLNNLPEWLVVLFGPIIVIFLSAIWVGASSIGYILLSIYNLRFFTKERKKYDNILNKQEITVDQWESFPDSDKWGQRNDYMSWWWGVICGLIMLCCFLIINAFSGPVSVVIFICCLITMFSYVGFMNKNPVTVSNIVVETLGQYKKLLAFIITILVINSAFSNIGTITGISAIVVVISIYFQWLPITIFQAFNFDNLSPFDDTYKQNTKTCSCPTTNPDIHIKYDTTSIWDLLGDLQVPITTNDTFVDDSSNNATNNATNNAPIDASTSENASSTSTSENASSTSTSENASSTSTSENASSGAPIDATNPVSENSIPVSENTSNPNLNLKGGGKKIKNKSLSKYKNKYNVLKY